MYVYWHMFLRWLNPLTTTLLFLYTLTLFWVLLKSGLNDFSSQTQFLSLALRAPLCSFFGALHCVVLRRMVFWAPILAWDGQSFEDRFPFPCFPLLIQHLIIGTNVSLNLRDECHCLTSEFVSFDPEGLILPLMSRPELTLGQSAPRALSIWTQPCRPLGSTFAASVCPCWGSQWRLSLPDSRNLAMAHWVWGLESGLLWFSTLCLGIEGGRRISVLLPLAFPVLNPHFWTHQWSLAVRVFRYNLHLEVLWSCLLCRNQKYCRSESDETQEQDCRVVRFQRLLRRQGLHAYKL